MMDRELFRQALDALEANLGNWAAKTKAIAALRERLAQPEQEPVTWRNAAIRVGEDLCSVGPFGYYEMTAEQRLDWAMAQEPRGKNSLPPHRKPMTDEQIEREWQFLHDEEGNPPDHHDFARAIEAAHGIKGQA